MSSPRKAVGIAAAVESLVMVPDDGAHAVQRAQITTEPITDDRMFLHQRALLGRERAGSSAGSHPACAILPMSWK